MNNIAIVTINYNSSDYTKRCVDSIYENSNDRRDYQIFIIDNNSTEKEYAKLKRNCRNENVTIIRNSKNSGYAAANMLALNYCQATYYFFLNNDTQILNDNLSILSEFMKTHPEAGIVSGQMYNNKGEPEININYIPDLKLRLLGSGLLRLFYPAQYPKKKKIYKSPVKVPVLNGSSLFVRGDVFEKLGGFDTNFFLYCEEEDIAIRFKKAGYSFYLIPSARYLHYSGKSSLQDERINLIMLKEYYISHYYLLKKHYGKPSAWIWRILQFIRTIRKFYIDSHYFALAFYILAGPDLSDSLRHKQVVRNS